MAATCVTKGLWETLDKLNFCVGAQLHALLSRTSYMNRVSARSILNISVGSVYYPFVFLLLFGHTSGRLYSLMIGQPHCTSTVTHTNTTAAVIQPNNDNHTPATHHFPWSSPCCLVCRARRVPAAAGAADKQYCKPCAWAYTGAGPWARTSL